MQGRKSCTCRFASYLQLSVTPHQAGKKMNVYQLTISQGFLHISEGCTMHNNNMCLLLKIFTMQKNTQ
jgi:hypothetical protein